MPQAKKKEGVRLTWPEHAASFPLDPVLEGGTAVAVVDALPPVVVAAQPTLLLARTAGRRALRVGVCGFTSIQRLEHSTTLRALNEQTLPDQSNLRTAHVTK